MQNREALFLPEIEDLFERAFKEVPDHDHVDVWGWVGAYLPDPDVGVFVARIDDRWCGLAIALARTDVWSPDPAVLFLYAGERGVFNALVEEIREFCLPYSRRFRMVNGTGASDIGYLRKLRRWVASGTPLGSLVDCEWRE